jgi:hypothetical protein
MIAVCFLAFSLATATTAWLAELPPENGCKRGKQDGGETKWPPILVIPAEYPFNSYQDKDTHRE